MATNKRTIEEKELLLKDLCARLPYGVIIHLVEPNEDEELYCLNIPQEGLYTRSLEHNNVTTLSPIEDIKPYLRPMSSMTEEEREYYNNHLSGIITGIDAANFMIWIYSNHLDIFHFIEKGLAIEVTEKNNPYKE